MLTFDEGIALCVYNGSNISVVGSVINANYYDMPKRVQLPSTMLDKFLTNIQAKNNWCVAIDVIGKHSLLIRVYEFNHDLPKDESDHVSFSCSFSNIKDFASSVIEYINNN